MNEIIYFFNVGSDYHHVQLVRGKPIKLAAGSPLTVREVGLFVVVETPYGLTVHWDKGTRVYIKLQRHHTNKVSIQVHTSHYCLITDGCNILALPDI